MKCENNALDITFEAFYAATALNSSNDFEKLFIYTPVGHFQSRCARFSLFLV